ncbi:MAG: carbohydrate kinase [Pseudomonadota bacterium]
MILCCGEALIDMLPRETGVGEPAFAPYPGGAVFNTAIALGRLDAASGFFSGLSTDLFGEMLERALAASKVDASLAARSARPTTLAFVRLVDGQATYAFYDENTAGRMLDPDDLPVIPDTVSAMFFGGISLMVEPCASAYLALMERNAGGRATMIDPNIRPSFIADPDRYRARIEAMVAAADIVKISDEDMTWLMGDGDIEVQAQALLTKGPSLICLTKGGEGAVGLTARDRIVVPAQRVAVVDTVGAGDTFNAGVLAALHQRGVLTKAGVAALSAEDVTAALTLGAQVAAITVSRAGANPPWAHEL